MLQLKIPVNLVIQVLFHVFETGILATTRVANGQEIAKLQF